MKNISICVITTPNNNFKFLIVIVHVVQGKNLPWYFILPLGQCISQYGKVISVITVKIS